MTGGPGVQAVYETMTDPASKLRLAYPQCPKGLGKIITSPDSPDLIADVRADPIAVWPDDRGYFLEAARLGVRGMEDFVETQVSVSLSYPGTIKAFHYHLEQYDYWTPAAGMLQAALIDLREESPTFGARNTFYIGSLRPWRLLIPPGVAHGYKVIGDAPAVLVYLTSRHYNPADEGRLPHDHAALNYDWSTQHK